MTPAEVMNSTTDEVKRVIDQVLKIEKDYKHIQNLSANRSVEVQIADKIFQVISKEIS